MARQQNDFSDLDVGLDWYADAAGQEFDVTWGNVDIWKADIPHLQFMRAQTIWMDRDLDDLQGRRRAVFAIAKKVLSPTGTMDAEIQSMWPLFGVSSITPRLTKKICSVYNRAPVRTFSKVQGVNEGFEQLYKLFAVNQAMQKAYRAALITNTVLIMPDWEGKSLRVLTPDYFRMKVDKNGKPTEVWVCHSSGGYKNNEFEVWTPTEHLWLDYQGKPSTKGVEGRKNVEPNPYGRIPAVLVQLEKTNDIYGAGITEAAEINAWSNLLHFLATNIAVFQSFSVAVATNMNMKPGTRIGPGNVLVAENLSGETSTQPNLTFVTPDGKFIDLSKFKQDQVNAFVRNHGFPAYLVDEGAGQPPSGIALQVAERDLNETREEHIHPLTEAERDLAELLPLMLRVHQPVRSLAIDATFSVNFAKPETFTEPSAELEFDNKLKAEGLISPSAMTQKYMGIVQSDEDAVALIAKNKALFAGQTPVQPIPVVS